MLENGKKENILNKIESLIALVEVSCATSFTHQSLINGTNVLQF